MSERDNQNPGDSTNDPESGKSGDAARPDRGPRRELAPNGEGQLAPPDATWAPDPTQLPTRDRIAAEGRRLKLDRAVAESTYVSDVFFFVQQQPLELHEAVLASIGAAADLHSRLRTSVSGTLGGDFVRWCRGRYPGIVARQLADVLAASGCRLAAEYVVEIELINRRAEGCG